MRRETHTLCRREIQTGSLARYTDRTGIAYIPQEPFLFQGTLRQNIVFDQDADDDILRSLLDKLALDLPLGITVEEAGSNLSGGQKTRVALARVLLNPPDLLVADELTANLDRELGRRIENMLLAEYPEMALCMVAHRTYCPEQYDVRWNLSSRGLEEVRT